MLVKGVPDHSRISHVWNSGVAGVAGVQEFRSSGVQEFRSSGVQLNDALLSQVFSPANVPHHPRLSSNSVTPELLS
jgi:hypothetical protein